METSRQVSYRDMLLSRNADSLNAPDEPADSKESIRSRIEESRRELLDLGLRNTLINYRTLPARGVEIKGESVAQVFNAIVIQGKAMRFLADSPEPARQSYRDHEADSRDIIASQSDNRLQTRESSDDLDKRLLNTFRAASASVEETGVNTLFLALGMLKWYESGSSQRVCHAPLVLVPVRLERTGNRRQFNVQYTGEDLGVNLSFIEKARADFGLTIPGQDALEADDSDIDAAGYIARVADAVRQSALPRWEVEADRIVLGFFSFSKFLMFRDLEDSSVEQNEIIAALFGGGFHEPPPDIGDGDHLDSRISPDDTYHVLDADSSQSLAIHDAVSGRNLVIQGPPGTGKSQTIANIIAEAVGHGQRVLFVSEKMAALEVVKRRLEGIGLGAACLELHSNKTNKRQTLDELSRTLNPDKQTSEASQFDCGELKRIQCQLNSYSRAVNTPVGDSGVTPVDALGKRMALGVDEETVPPALTRMEGIRDWSGEDFRRKRETVDELRQRLQSVGIPNRHPFHGCRLISLSSAAQSSLREKIAAAASERESLTDSSASLADSMRLARPYDITGLEALLETARLAQNAPDLRGLALSAPEWQTHAPQIEGLLDKGLLWRQVRSSFDSELLPEAWDADLRQTRLILNTTGRSFWGRLFSGKYRQARQQLASVMRGELPKPKDVDRQISLIDAIIEEQQLKADIAGDYSGAAVAFGSLWDGCNTDWAALAPPVRWWLEHSGRVDSGIIDALQTRANDNAPDLAGVIEQAGRALNAYQTSAAELQSALDLDKEARFNCPEGLTALPFTEQQHVLDNWAACFPQIQDIIGFNNGAEAAVREDLHPAVCVAKQNSDAAAQMTNWLEFVWYNSILEKASEERPAMQGFNRQIHEGRIERFRNLDRQFLEFNRSRVSQVHSEAASLSRQLPERLVRSSNSADKETRQMQQQLRLLQREIEKQRRHKPIRRLLAEAGGVIQCIKPVFMMSPLSIANYLAPGSVHFDLVLFDEASQVRPVDALGSLLRAQKAVVVGDSKQMPPTSFFDRISHGDEDAGDEEESVTADMESILGLFVSQAAPSRTLRWHYRSRHESLIAVSNREFYDNNLIVFSSPDAGRKSGGLQHHHLPDAVYDRGRSRTNPKEAEAVAKAVMDHAARSPDLSLGVAAFSQAQAQAIEDRLEKLRRENNSCEEFFASHPDEPFFVKNLENVQGDERDVIFISIGYGRDERGQVNQNFGPINKGGGERRLNVLITRAKRQCHVFTNLHYTDITSQTVGMLKLRTFLAYAESGQMPDNPTVSNREVDSPFQRAVAARLTERGYQVQQEVASGGRFVDIAIVDPQQSGRYVIGIECDGASYHSSRSARDRDRLREQVLVGLGWKLHRIWSTDWFQNPDRELDRAIKAIEKAKSQS